jgi:hypothetical protein
MRQLMLLPILLVMISLLGKMEGAADMSVNTTMDDLSSQIAEIMPTAAEEKWRSVPWRIDLMSARKEAASSNKPIFLWLMNGHPMGCT